MLPIAILTMNPRQSPTAKQMARALLAEGELSIAQIANRLSVSEKTIDRWNREPEFRASVQQTVSARRTEFLGQQLARKQGRISALTLQFDQLWHIMRERGATKKMRKIPGGKSGLIRKTLKSASSGASATIVEAYAADIKFSREIRRTLEQIARETRGLTEQPDLGRYPIVVNVMVNACAWTKQRETAAALLAEGEFRIPQIAKSVGVSEKTIDRWSRHRDFQARVEENVAALSARFEWQRLARKEVRIARLTELFWRLDQIVRERGLGLRTLKSFGTGSSTRVVEEYRIDSPLAGEMCRTLAQIAKEVGPSAENENLSNSSGGPIESEQRPDLSRLSDEELAFYERIVAKITTAPSDCS